MAMNAIAPVTPATAYRDAAGMNYLDQTSTQFPRDVHKQLIQLNPNTGRLGTTFKMFGKAQNDDVEHPFQFEHYWQRERPLHVTVSGTVADPATTTITLASGDVNKITNGQILIVERTGERLRTALAVADAFSGATITNVVRSYGATPAQALLDGDRLLIGPVVRSEASVDPQPIGWRQDNVTGYLTEVSLATGATMRMMNSIQYAGWSWKEEQKMVAEEFKRQMDFLTLFSELDTRTDTDGYHTSTSRGFFEVTQTNVRTLDSVPDWPTLQQALRPFGRYGNGGRDGKALKHCFISPAWSDLIGSYSSTMLRLNNVESVKDQEKGITFGWNVSRLNSGGVEYVLHVVPWWGDYGQVGPFQLANMFLVIDMNHCGHRFGKNRHVRLLPKRAANNVNQDAACWYADFSPVWELEAANGYMTAPLV